jgi:hypothetical protein
MNTNTSTKRWKFKIERNIPLIVSETFRTSFPDKEPVWFSITKVALIKN